MSLNEQQQNVIISIDKKVKVLLANGIDGEQMLVEMLDFMPAIKEFIDFVPKKEIELYFYECAGFYHYIKVLEHLAQGLAGGCINTAD